MPAVTAFAKRAAADTARIVSPPAAERLSKPRPRGEQGGSLPLDARFSLPPCTPRCWRRSRSQRRTVKAAERRAPVKHFKRGVWRDAPLAFTSTPRRSAQAWIPRCHRSRRRARPVERNPVAGDRSPRRFRIGQRNRAGSKLIVTRPQAEDRKERQNADTAQSGCCRKARHPLRKERAAKREARSPQELSRPPSDPFCSREKTDGLRPRNVRFPT